MEECHPYSGNSLDGVYILNAAFHGRCSQVLLKTPILRFGTRHVKIKIGRGEPPAAALFIRNAPLRIGVRRDGCAGAPHKVLA